MDFDGDEMYAIFLKTRDMVKACKNLHPKETILDKNSLALSGHVSMTKPSFIHWTSFMNTIEDGDKDIRFEMPSVS